MRPRTLRPSVFQSTSSVWRTTYETRLLDATEWISIHVLRVEDDGILPSGGDNQMDISIHVLRVEDDTLCPALPGGARLISIHVLRVEDDHGTGDARAGRDAISIHVLRVEDDRPSTAIFVPLCRFQSTSSVWRTTAAKCKKKR